MNLHPLEVADYKTLKGVFQNQPYALSPYSLSSLIAWSGQGFRSYYAIENGTVIIANESMKRPEDGHLMLPISTGGDYDPDGLQRFIRETGFTHYRYVPEGYLEKHRRGQIERIFRVTEQEEYEDYVYLTEDIVQLKGNKYAKKRNLIHQFMRIYAEQGRVSVERMTGATAAESLDFLEKWCEIHNCDADSEGTLACEKRAIITTVNNIEALEVTGILVRIDGAVSAFWIASHLTADTAVLNFEKAFSHIKGLYQFLDRECAEQLFGRYRYLNKESDMNIPNLARSKKSYNPLRRIKSYCLELL